MEGCKTCQKFRCVAAYCQRWVHNATRTREVRHSGELPTCESSNQQSCCVKEVQGMSFSDELQAIKTDNPLPKSSKFIHDANGVLCVDGPQNGISSLQKRHLFMFSVIPESSIILSTLSSTISCSCWVPVATIKSSWIVWTWGKDKNKGARAFDSSPDDGLQPWTSLLSRINLFPAWNTVKHLDCSSNSN